MFLVSTEEGTRLRYPQPPAQLAGRTGRGCLGKALGPLPERDREDPCDRGIQRHIGTAC